MPTAVLRSRRGCTAAVLLSAVVACSRGDGSGPVAVSVPSAPPPVERSCSRLAAQLPASLGDGLNRRGTTPESPLVAAWGDPAVVLRCGVAVDEDYSPGDQLIHANSEIVGWWQKKSGETVIWQTPNTTVHVELRVPTSYDGHGSFLARLSPLVEAMGPF
jgi:hypothetical protein